MKATTFRSGSHIYLPLIGMLSISSLLGGVPCTGISASPHVSLMAQTQSVIARGVVTEENGTPLIGVTIKVKGTSRGTISDMQGTFEIEVPTGADLEFSYIGFSPVTLPASSQMKVVMKEDAGKLEEVVVVGYGSSKRRDLISSVSTVQAKEITNIPVTNLGQGLAGRSPGVIVMGNGGGVNATPLISIRGGGEPLYVIDGVVRSAADFMALSPDDIQNFSILKDASATAVYGSRASNGIIQVTTKSGRAGKVMVNYDYSLSYSQPGIWRRQLGAYDRAVYANEAHTNDGVEPPFNSAALKAIEDGTDPIHYNDVNYRELVFRDWAPQQKHAVRLSGGSKNTTFFASLGHVSQNSLYRSGNHWMKRTNIRLSQSTLLEAYNIRVNTTLDGYRQSDSHPSSSTASSYYEIFSHVNNNSPLYPALNKYGLPYNISNNPVAETAADAGYKRETNNVINARGELIWTVPWVEELRLRAATNYRYTFNEGKNWRKDAATYDWDSTTPQYSIEPRLRKSFQNGYSFTNQLFADYDLTRDIHSISALAGFEQYYGFGNNYWLQRDKFLFPIDQILAGDANEQTNGGQEAEEGRAAFIGQLKYNLRNRYYLEGSMRYDGSDRFLPGKRWGAFFSGSLGWVISEEEFMQPLMERNIINNLKLRATYGETGLDSSAGRFAYLTSYTLNSQSYVVDGKYAPGFSEGAMPSPDLTWFTTRQTDLGFDFISMRGRLYGSADYFFYSTKGYLMIPRGRDYINNVIGIDMPMVKSNSENRREGVELQLGWRDNVGDLSYTISANFTYFDEIWARKEDESEASLKNPYIRVQQQRGYYATMLESQGFFHSAEEVYNAVTPKDAATSGYLSAGDLHYVDANGDGQINEADYRRRGKNPMPRGQFGLSINLDYKGFYFNTLFQGSTSFHTYIPGSIAMQTGKTGNLMVMYDFQTDYWRPDHTEAQFPRLMSNTALNADNNYLKSDFWLVNAAYVRTKDIQVGYDLKHSILKDADWLTSARLGLSGQNIFTLSKAARYGMDPETSSPEGNSYPVERSLAVTLNLGF